MSRDPAAPIDYSSPFWLDGRRGNNAFAYERRGPSPRLRVPSLVDGSWTDLVPGNDVVFADVDEHDVLQQCQGLRHLVRTTWDEVPTVVVDNHNHVFYFWFEALLDGRLGRRATLVHLDQHRDTRAPETVFPSDGSLIDAFRYTNFHLNVGNYIVPARDAGLIGDVLFVTGSDGLADRSHAGRRNLILNIDLDFFAPEMSYVDFDRVRRFVDRHRATASLITIATSPFFVNQDLALDALVRLVEG